jgi:hypothetical protein
MWWRRRKGAHLILTFFRLELCRRGHPLTASVDGTPELDASGDALSGEVTALCGYPCFSSVGPSSSLD